MITSHRPLATSWQELWEHLEGITGYGVAEAAYLAAHHFGLWRDGIRIAVQGFGVVGRGTVQRLTQHGAMLVAAADKFSSVVGSGGLPVDALMAATDQAGTIDRQLLPGTFLTSTTPDAWVDVDADILVLAAGGGALHAGNVSRVRACLVVEGANSPCAPAAIDTLTARGVPVIPGIAANSGSATVTALVLSGMLPYNSGVEDVGSLKKYFFNYVAVQVRRTLLDVIAHAEATHLPLHQAAEDLATRFLTARVGANHPARIDQNGEGRTQCR
jgi:glutamate dehydrogenase (NAD(P)+)